MRVYVVSIEYNVGACAGGEANQVVDSVHATQESAQARIAALVNEAVTEGALVYGRTEHQPDEAEDDSLDEWDRDFHIEEFEVSGA